MRIIYFTTAIREEDYVDFIKEWKISLNPSNQNFHNKMIRALAKTDQVEVVSLRPFSRTKCSLKRLPSEDILDGNIIWHYLKVTKGRLFRMHAARKQIKKIYSEEDFEPTVIVSDTINPKIIRLANYLNKRKHYKIAGICTDSPSNISGTRKSYSLYILSQSKNLDGYIALTESLNNLFNENDKPSILVEGIVEDSLPEPLENTYGKYLFFGGALLPRYGVYDLIESFNELKNPDVKLLICGHHGDNHRLEEAFKGNKNIVNLKLLPVKDVLTLEQNAILNINPRPYSEDLDRYSVPSKTLEYMSTGTPTLSVRNTRLQKLFENECFWVKSSKKEDLLPALKQAISMSDVERKEFGEKAKKKVRDLYSLTSVNKKVMEFLKNL